MINRSNHQLYEIEQRLKKLEDKVFGSKKESTTNQQMLLLKFTGLLDKISQLETSNENKYKLLGRMLNRDKDSIKKAYLEISGNKEDILTPANLQFVIDTLENNGLNQLTTKPRKILTAVEVNWSKPE